jgi:methionyl-tRNA formyltransferase
LLLFSPKGVRKQFPEPPGTILRANGEGLLVAAGEDALLIRDIQPEGRKRMDVGTWLRGARIPAGARFC